MANRLRVYLVLLGILYLVVIAVQVRSPYLTDFAKFYASAELYWEGKSIYSSVRADHFIDWEREWGPNPGLLHPNLNPPFLTLLVIPFLLFDFKLAFWIWSLLSLGAGLFSMLILERETRGERDPELRRLLFPILLLAYFPTWANFQYGQLALLILLLYTGAWLALRRGSGVWAGVMLGFALSLKVFTALFVLLFLVRRRWLCLIAMGLTALFCGLLGIAVFGWERLEEYRSVVREITWAGTSWNPSFLGFSSRLFGGGENVPLVNLPIVARTLASLLSVLSAVFLTIVVRPRPGEDSRARLEMGYVLTLPLILLISPLGWMYYFPILLISYVVIWHRAETDDSARRYRWHLVLSFVLSTFPALHILPVTLLDRFLYSDVFFIALFLLAYVALKLGSRVGIPAEVPAREEPV